MATEVGVVMVVGVGMGVGVGMVSRLENKLDVLEIYFKLHSQL